VDKKNRYIPAIDAMRAIAILAVVAIHTTTKTLAASNDIPGFTFTFFINQATRFAVPLFFMIYGFVLELNSPFNQNYFAYFKKRFSKIFLPYLFWSLVYFYFVYPHPLTSLWPLRDALLYGTSSYQLYFIPALLVFYALFPLFNSCYRFLANKWVMLVLGIAQLYLLYQTYYVRPLSIPYPFAIALLNYYPFILGMAASHHQDFLQKMSKWKIIIGILTVMLGVAVFIQGRTLYLKTNNYLYFYTQWRPSVLLYTIFIAAFLYILFNKLNLNIKIIQTFSKLSFFVFFIHIIILEQFWSFIGKKIVGGEIFFNLLFFLTVAGISYLVAYSAHKIPLLSKITG
jgi:surface polysaccharide O-acyltransferase-like enzyme